MKEILQYLYESSNKSESFYRHPGSVGFNINGFDVIIAYAISKPFDNDYIGSINNLIKRVSKLKVKEFKISISVPFDDREIQGQWYKGKQNHHYPPPIESIANTVFHLAREFSKIDSEIVTSNIFLIDDPYDEGMCGWHPLYFGEVQLDINKINLIVVKDLLNILNSSNIVKVNDIYCSSYDAFTLPKNNFTEQFLNTNTKVRRLGYLKIFFKYIDEKKRIPENFINTKFEDYALNFSSQLDELIYNKGIIQSQKGKSAEPYVSLLKEMDLITSINRVVVPTKWLRTYLVLRKDFPLNENSIFSLDELDKLFFLEIILKYDFLYSSVIFEFLFIHDKVTIKELTKIFQSLLLLRLKNLIEQSRQENKALLKLKEIERRVSEWKKPEVYLEHIIMPRVNWLADLGLIFLEENVLFITEECRRLSTGINSWIDIGAEFVSDSTEFLQKFYPHIYTRTYRNDDGKYPNQEIIIALCDVYLNRSFEVFKTLAPNRVTSSQAFTYVKYCIYLKEGFSVSENYLAELVEKKLSYKYVYKHQSRYGDGYLQKIKN